MELTLGFSQDATPMGQNQLPNLRSLVEEEGSDQLLRRFCESSFMWEGGLREANSRVLRDRLTEVIVVLDRLELHMAAEELRDSTAAGSSISASWRLDM